MMTLCSVDNYRNLVTTSVRTDGTETSKRVPIIDDEFLLCASNMGSPAYFPTGRWCNSVTMFDWFTDKQVGETVLFDKNRPAEYICNSVWVESMAIVAGTSIVLGYRTHNNEVVLLTPNGQIRMNDIMGCKSAFAECTGRYLHMRSIAHDDTFRPYGEELPFAWWLPYSTGTASFAAFENMVAGRDSAPYNKNVTNIRDMRTRDIITFVGPPYELFDSNMWSRSVFTCDYLLSTCIEHEYASAGKKFMSTLLVYDLRNPNVFYDMINGDREIIPTLTCAAFA